MANWFKIFLIIIFIPIGLLGQNKSHSFFMEGDFMQLNIDLRQNNKSIDSLLQIAKIRDITSFDIRKTKFKKLIANGWTIKKTDGIILELRRSLQCLSIISGNNLISIVSKIMNNGIELGYDTRADFGVNNFSKITVKELDNGKTRFFLPGNRNVAQVILSGSFNLWSVSDDLMTKTSDGWEITIKMEEGMHLYKFIIDGYWQNDQFNLNKKPDGHDGYNSIYFKYNTEVTLTGYTDKSKVVLSGDFNNWNEQLLALQKTDSGWKLPMYLKEGRHEYKFIVDKDWITDPANSNKVLNQEGTYNSVIYIGHQTEFKINALSAKKVFVSGTFNTWQPNVDPLKPELDFWKINLNLPKGNYQYKYIIDGKWILDANNPHTAMDGDIVNSLKVVQPNTNFCIKDFKNAKKVAISGDFNNWDEYGYTLFQNNECWVIDIYLKPGKHLYKLIVDGKWIKDPENNLYEPNEYDDYNSVLWVK
jgi:1,4-alpha-glucan branching enzyme